MEREREMCVCVCVCMCTVLVFSAQYALCWQSWLLTGMSYCAEQYHEDDSEKREKSEGEGERSAILYSSTVPVRGGGGGRREEERPVVVIV